MAQYEWGQGQQGGYIRSPERPVQPTWAERTGITTFLQSLIDKTKSDYEREQVARAEYAKQRMADEAAMERVKYEADASIKQAELGKLYDALALADTPEKVAAISSRIAELTGQQPPQPDPLELAIKTRDWNNLPPHPDGTPWTAEDIAVAAQGKVKAGEELAVAESFKKWENNKKKAQAEIDKRKVAEERVARYKSIVPGSPQDVIERGIPEFIKRQDPLLALTSVMSGPTAPFIYGANVAAKEALKLPAIQPYLEPLKQIPRKIESWYTGKPSTNLPVMIPPKE